MIEGWYGEEYLILFADSEIPAVSNRYSVAKYLPGFEIVGIRSWDDFIVRNASGRTFLVPTVPVDERHLSPFQLADSPELEADARSSGRIKWYIKPLVFGGDPRSSSNVNWIDHSQHAALVIWWNDLYRSTSPPPAR